MIKFNSKWNMDLNLKSKITLHQEESILKNDLSDIKIWKCFWSMPWKWKWSRLVAQLCLTLCDHGPFTPWTVAYQAPPSMGFSRQAYWSGLPLPSSGDLPNPGIKPVSPALAGRFYFFFFYFILLYNTVLVLPYIDMNPPWVYLRSHT